MGKEISYFRRVREGINYCCEYNWLALWFRLGSPASYDKIMKAHSELLERYLEPHRRYHNIGHINHCLTELNTVSHLALEPDVLELAIWYYDAIYEIGADDNEERSALLAEEVMKDLLLPVDLIEKVKNIITATKHTEVPEDFDAKLMLDIDISNIGDADKFKETNKLVREEYSSIPDNLFASGRSDILQSFLNRPSIYLTEVFQEKYEQSARENIKAAISELNN